MIDIHLWAWPLSLLLMAIFVIGVALCYKSHKFRIISALHSRSFAISIIAIVVGLMATEGTWALNLFHTWSFVLCVVLMMLSLGVVTCCGAKLHILSYSFLSHAGLLLVLVGGLFGAADVSDSQILVTYDYPEHLSYKTNGEVVPLPFKIQLKEFRIDYYADGKNPKQYTSTLEIDGKKMQTSVNHPCKYNGWDIYQSSYDTEGQQYSILKVVKDPWLPVVYLGFLLLVTGAIFGLRDTWHNKYAIPIVCVLTILFTCLSLAKINLSTLVPALRSIWFLPHIIIYMVAYSLLAIASVMSIWALCKGKSQDISSKLLNTVSSLLLIGMICGAVWAKAAWGQYWTWDGKECWAAATWMITLLGIHRPTRMSKWILPLSIWLAFAAMQITWYGVNYLPSAAMSLHTYNS